MFTDAGWKFWNFPSAIDKAGGYNGFYNISIHPDIFQKMANNPDKMEMFMADFITVIENQPKDIASLQESKAKLPSNSRLVGAGVEFNKDGSINRWASSKGSNKIEGSTSVHLVSANRASESRNIAQELFDKLLEESRRAKRLRDINMAEQQRLEKAVETSFDFISQDDYRAAIHKLSGTK